MTLPSHLRALLRTTLLTTLVAVLLTLASVAGPDHARAGTFTVHACQYPDGRAAPVDGWQGTVGGGAYSYFGSACDTGGGLQTWLDPSHDHPGETYASYRLRAPQDLSVVGLEARRDRRLDTGAPYANPYTFVDAEVSNLEACTIATGCNDANGQFSYWFGPSSWVQFSAKCDGTATCPARTEHKAFIALSHIKVWLRDDFAPIVNAVGGPLVLGDVRTGVQTATLDLSDRGGGVKDAAVVVDGRDHGFQVLDTNGGRCVQPYGYRTPCKLDAVGTIALDTATVPDGPHELKVVARDVADNERLVVAPRSVVFDNRPPAMSTPGVSGTATQGHALTCTPKDVDGQSPSIGFEWLRSRADGSGTTAIEDATAASYTLQAADVGTKVRCRVTATDRGGATTRQSGLSDGPFADGATVQPTPTPTPTPTAGGGGNGGDGGNGGTGGDGNGGGAGGTGGPGGTTTVVLNGPAAAQGARLHAVFANSNAGAVLTPYGRAITIRGKLDDLNGAPIPHALIDVVARPEHGGGAERLVATTRTRPDGTFTARLLARVPSSELVLRHRAVPGGPPVATTTLDLRVAAGLTLAVTRTVKARGLIRFVGRLLTRPIPSRGKVIELRARGGNGRWILFKTVRTNRRGAFRAVYRLRRGFRGITYQFQAVARAESGYPYAAGGSPVRKTRVR